MEAMRLTALIDKLISFLFGCIAIFRQNLGFREGGVSLMLVGRSVDRSVGKKRGENLEVVREILPGLIRPGSNTSYIFDFAYRGNTVRPVRLTQASKPS